MQVIWAEDMLLPVWRVVIDQYESVEKNIYIPFIQPVFCENETLLDTI